MAFTQPELRKHIKEGDSLTNLKGHPLCQFCRENFYGNEQLHEHMEKKHQECGLCSKNGIHYQYFKNFNKLEEHYATEHFLCNNQNCRLIAFNTEIELKNHQLEEHKGEYSNKLDLSFNYPSFRNQNNRNNNSSNQIHENTNQPRSDDYIRNLPKPPLDLFELEQ